MSADKLRARFDELKRETAHILQRLPEAQSSGLAPLAGKLEELTSLCLQTLARAEAEIAELRRQLFGKRAERLTAEQEEQWQKLCSDKMAEATRPDAVSGEILLPESRAERRRRQHARRRHPLPQELVTETITLKPEASVCPCCGRPLVRIGEEVTEEIDMVPARLIRRRIVRRQPNHIRRDHARSCSLAGRTPLWMVMISDNYIDRMTTIRLTGSLPP